MLSLFFFFVILSLNTLSSCNYLVNGNFELPLVSYGTSSSAAPPTGWTGHNYEICNIPSFGVGFGQFMDLQRMNWVGQNGYIQQIVNIPYITECVLSFYQKAKTTNFN